MTFPLPFPYVPGDAPPDSPEDRAQQNFDKIALKLGEDDGLRTTAGIVSSTGVKLAGYNFSASHLGTGLYEVTFSPPFAAVPAVTLGMGATPGAYAVKITDLFPVSASTVRMTVFDTGSTLPTDGEFHFAAVGPR